jgi:hypothetical protein
MVDQSGWRKAAALIKPALWIRLFVIWAGAELFDLSPTLLSNKSGLAWTLSFIGFFIMGSGMINAFFWMLDHDGVDFKNGKT